MISGGKRTTVLAMRWLRGDAMTATSMSHCEAERSDGRGNLPVFRSRCSINSQIAISQSQIIRYGVTVITRLSLSGGFPFP